MKEGVFLEEFIRKINSLSGRSKLFPSCKIVKIKGIHLPTLEFFIARKKMEKSNFLKKIIQIPRQEIKGISDVVQNQDLHLFQLQKIYLEKNPSLKGASFWKLPKKQLVQQRLKTFSTGLGFNFKVYKDHSVTWIAKI